MSQQPAASYRFQPTILREYDIRGIVGETLSEADAYAIGRAFAAMLVKVGGGSVAVGRDGRLSSPGLEAALVRGLTDSGVDVVRIGLGPMPVLYYAVFTAGVDGGIMITGSHNPKDHNGFKMMIGKKPFYGADIQTLGVIAASGEVPSGAGKVVDRDLLGVYVGRLVQDYDG